MDINSKNSFNINWSWKVIIISFIVVSLIVYIIDSFGFTDKVKTIEPLYIVIFSVSIIFYQIWITYIMNTLKFEIIELKMQINLRDKIIEKLKIQEKNKKN
tara:strand:+ start:1166 stop:1468 length:303 start_codon:yes stop_codon:yes gene_type:complete